MVESGTYNKEGASQGEREGRGEGEEGEGRGRRTKQRMVEVTRRENHMREGTRRRKRWDLSISAGTQMVSKTDTHTTAKEKIMTLERRNKTQAMELGGKGQGMIEHQRMTISAVLDGWTD